MNLKPNHISLNGKQVTVSSLLNNSTSNAGLENDLVVFLKEWYSDENYILVQTSGSTGQPKTIKLNKNFVAASAKRTVEFFRLQAYDRILHCLPLKYIAGKLMVVRAVIGKLDLHIVQPESDFALLEKEKFKFAAMVPNQVSKLFELNLKSWNIEQLLIGGDAISSNLERRLKSTTTACYSSYGMTETATHIALRKLNGPDSNLFYHCLDNIQVQLGKDKNLEIFVPGLTQQPLSTTDLAELKDNKTFRIFGRSDNIIISGGIKFSPEEIEKKLESEITIPFMISSLTHEKLGKQLVLLIENEENKELKRELQIICKTKLDKFECPRQIVFVQILPKTANGKLKRS